MHVHIRARHVDRDVTGSPRRSEGPKCACDRGSGAAGSRRRHGGNRDIRYGIRDAIVEPRGAYREIGERPQRHAGLAAVQPLGTQLIVGQGQRRADELPVQLLSVGARKPPPASPQTLITLLTRYSAATRGSPRCRIDPGTACCWPSAPGRHVGFEVVAVVVPPVVDACAERHGEVAERLITSWTNALRCAACLRTAAEE